MAAPAQDKFWWRLRQEVRLLNALLAFDEGLVQQSIDVERVVTLWTAAEWQADDLACSLRPGFSYLRHSFGTGSTCSFNHCRGKLFPYPVVILIESTKKLSSLRNGDEKRRYSGGARISDRAEGRSR